MSKAVTITRVDELRAVLTFAGVGGGHVALWEVEAFCQALRAAGAPGVLAIRATQTYERQIVLEAIQPHPNPVEVER